MPLNLQEWMQSVCDDGGARKGTSRKEEIRKRSNSTQREGAVFTCPAGHHAQYGEAVRAPGACPDTDPTWGYLVDDDDSSRLLVVLALAPVVVFAFASAFEVALVVVPEAARNNRLPLLPLVAYTWPSVIGMASGNGEAGLILRSRFHSRAFKAASASALRATTPITVVASSTPTSPAATACSWLKLYCPGGQ
jgi:hypothetical protein